MIETTMSRPAVSASARAVAAWSDDGIHAGSAVCWGAIVAGAAGAAALSLILLILGVGLGLSSISPWSNQGVNAGSVGTSTIVWITFTQLAASGMGGYLAGRLRTRWAGTHTDEVYFRDTAHGFLAWALATLVTAATLTSAVGSIVASGAQAGAAVAGGAATTAAAAMPAATAAASRSVGSGDNAANPGYFVDSLFRTDATNGNASTNNSATAAGQDLDRSGAEVGRIFANAMSTGALSADDTHYVGQMVAQRTGLSQADAEKRVTDSFNRMQTGVKNAEAAAKDAADKARKASAYAALWLFVSLLFGAFVASLSATFGGRRRDQF